MYYTILITCFICVVTLATTVRGQLLVRVGAKGGFWRFVPLFQNYWLVKLHNAEVEPGNTMFKLIQTLVPLLGGSVAALYFSQISKVRGNNSVGGYWGYRFAVPLGFLAR
jgi:hypothetical protein